MNKPSFTYKAKCTRVIDGDTIDATIDLGFNVLKKIRIRFYGLDTWESRTRDLEEKKKGLEAKKRVESLLEMSNMDFTLVSHGVGKKIKKFREEMPWPFNTLVRRQFNLEARDRQKRKK